MAPPVIWIFCQVQPQSHTICTAVRQLLNFRLRAVYCWEPARQPMFPPLKVKSETKPPLPFSVKIPTWVTLLPEVASGILKTRFCRLVPWATCQWMPVGTFAMLALPFRMVIFKLEISLWTTILTAYVSKKMVHDITYERLVIVSCGAGHQS